MSNATFYWHDYETFGLDPQRDRACQFAGIRTDAEFTIIGEPLMLYCQVADDYLPDPEACLITGITPQLANAQGVCEAEFIRQIHQQLAEPGTCGLGYNSLRFDDEVTRNLLYRNFYDPYAREWQNNNSRWDLIDVVRACYALRPEGINWPLNDEGSPQFKLEALTAANQISHQAAHDALSDVYATIAIAALIKQKQPKLFNYLFTHRFKAKALALLNVGSFIPLVHVSGRYSAKNNCLAVVLPLCMHPSRETEVVVYDLSIDPSPLLSLSADEIQQRLFTASADLPAGELRIPLKTVHINKYPVLAPLNVIRPQDAQRLSLDLNRCQAHLDQIRAADDLTFKLSQVYNRPYSVTETDPDLMIYSGGFFSNQDKASINKIRQTRPELLAELKLHFNDQRLEQMLFRYRGRNFPNTLSDSERQQWQAFCRQKLDEGQPSLRAKLISKIETLQLSHGDDQSLLKQLLVYVSKQNN